MCVSSAQCVLWYGAEIKWMLGAEALSAWCLWIYKIISFQCAIKGPLSRVFIELDVLDWG